MLKPTEQELEAFVGTELESSARVVCTLILEPYGLYLPFQSEGLIFRLPHGRQQRLAFTPSCGLLLGSLPQSHIIPFLLLEHII